MCIDVEFGLDIKRSVICYSYNTKHHEKDTVAISCMIFAPKHTFRLHCNAFF